MGRFSSNMDFENSVASLRLQNSHFARFCRTYKFVLEQDWSLGNINVLEERTFIFFISNVYYIFFIFNVFLSQVNGIQSLLELTDSCNNYVVTFSNSLYWWLNHQLSSAIIFGNCKSVHPYQICSAIRLG